MRYVIVIQSPYRSETEAVVGPFETFQQAETARGELIDRSERLPKRVGETVVHPDCVGEIVPLGWADDLAAISDGGPVIGPSGLWPAKQEELG